jgi:hypothetical protein
MLFTSGNCSDTMFCCFLLPVAVVVVIQCKLALKSAIPSVEEPVGRLEGIGEQAVATLKSLARLTHSFPSLETLDTMCAPLCCLLLLVASCAINNAGLR